MLQNLDNIQSDFDKNAIENKINNDQQLKKSQTNFNKSKKDF
jgi:hypothetical protein